MEAVVHPDTTVTFRRVSISAPSENELLIRTMAFGTNPKDWKLPLWTNKEHNSGDDVAGIVQAVGAKAYGFKVGDRVAGFHVALTKAGAFGEYALVPSHTAFHIPTAISFEQAATVPLAALTSATVLFKDLELPSPWQTSRSGPLLVYGASTAVGAYAIKLAAMSQIHPIVAVGSSSSEFVHEYLNTTKGDTFIDYTVHDDPESLILAIKTALESRISDEDLSVSALDAVSEHSSFGTVLSKVLSSLATSKRLRLAVVIPGKDYSAVDPMIEVVQPNVSSAHSGLITDRMFAITWMALFANGLDIGWLKPHPHEMIKEGLGGLEGALRSLRAGEVRGKKLVGKMSDTPHRVFE